MPFRLALALTLAFFQFRSSADSIKASERARLSYQSAKANFAAHSGDAKPAEDLARTAFDWAEFVSKISDREAIANDGIAAARREVELSPSSAAAHFYLALNLGQLARTKHLGALKLVKEMEREFLKAISLDPKVEYAGPERSLGMLYFEAPPWPTSIGNKFKAREHLQKAVELAPDFPDNQLSWIEALQKWGETNAARNAYQKYRQEILAKAKEKFKGPDWVSAWDDWNERAQKITEKLAE